MRQKSLLFIIICICIFNSCKNTNKKIDKSEIFSDTLLEEAKFWVYVFNINNDIICFSDTNSIMDSISFILHNKTVTKEFVKYEFDFFKTDSNDKCCMIGSKIVGIGFFRNNTKRKFPIYLNIQYGNIRDSTKMNELFTFAEKKIKKLYKEKPQEILINKEIRKFALQNGYL